MSAEQADRIWRGLERRLAAVESFVDDPPAWVPPAMAGERRRARVHPGPGVVPLSASVRRRRSIEGLPVLAAFAAVVCVVVVLSIFRPAAGPGATPSAAVSPSAAQSHRPSESAAAVPTASFASEAFGWSVSYPADWTVLDEPFADDRRGTTSFALPNAAGQIFVSVGTPEAGAPEPCTGCARFTSSTLDPLVREVLDFHLAQHFNAPSRGDVPITVTPDALGGEPALLGSQAYGDEHDQIDYVLAAFHDRQPFVISLVPNVPQGNERELFLQFAREFTFTAP